MNNQQLTRRAAAPTGGGELLQQVWVPAAVPGPSLRSFRGSAECYRETELTMMQSLVSWLHSSPRLVFLFPHAEASMEPSIVTVFMGNALLIYLWRASSSVNAPIRNESRHACGEWMHSGINSVE